VIDTAVILAGGLGTRLRPVTETIPKALVEVAGRPFVDRQLTLLRSRGFRTVVLCLGYLGDRVERLVGDGSTWQLEIRYAYDGPQLAGTGGALRGCTHLLPESFWVLYGDSYLDFDYETVAVHLGRHGRARLGLMTVFRNENRWDTSNVVFQSGRLVRYDKHTRTPDMRYIDYGATILRKAALERVPMGVPYDLANLYSGLVQDGLMLGYEVDRRFYEIGSPAGLEEATRYFEERAAGTGGPREQRR
jgi:NDP-sugar pyrophosphorylase family protein